MHILGRFSGLLPTRFFPLLPRNRLKIYRKIKSDSQAFGFQPLGSTERFALFRKQEEEAHINFIDISQHTCPKNKRPKKTWEGVCIDTFPVRLETAFKPVTSSFSLNAI
jgi:hypothetical protein